ncbi:hypothetical protein [Xanthomonas sacchari]|uniref:hypothetical protein n=1 Tax=Xanthomonas sacchari TaxID=56458 RepID=UPI0031BD7A49|nr:hypothetical protein [Xanthomonas campestris pv. cannae]
MSGARDGDTSPMVIISASYDGSEVTVTWQPFTEDKLTGYIVTLLQVGVGMNNVQVNDPSAVSKTFGVLLKAGDAYQTWVTPLLRPGFPDVPNQSNVVPIPYPSTLAVQGSST